MKTAYRLLSVLLAVSLLLCCAPLALADTPTFSDPASAAAYIRAGMLEHKAEIPFTYAAKSSDIGELNNANISNYFKKQWQLIDQAVVAHTGVSYEGDYLEKHLGVMDNTAAALAGNSRLPILVFNLNDPNNIKKAVLGENIGTIVR